MNSSLVRGSVFTYSFFWACRLESFGWWLRRRELPLLLEAGSRDLGCFEAGSLVVAGRSGVG